MFKKKCSAQERLKEVMFYCQSEIAKYEFRVSVPFKGCEFLSFECHTLVLEITTWYRHMR